MTLHALTTLSNSEATRLTPLGMHSGMDITIQNVDPSAYVYIGGENVNSEDFGYRLLPNNALAFELPPLDSIYAISSVNGSVIAVMQVGLE